MIILHYILQIASCIRIHLNIKYTRTTYYTREISAFYKNCIINCIYAFMYFVLFILFNNIILTYLFWKALVIVLQDTIMNIYISIYIFSMRK